MFENYIFRLIYNLNKCGVMSKLEFKVEEAREKKLGEVIKWCLRKFGDAFWIEF